jgi:hypothetical protein
MKRFDDPNAFELDTLAVPELIQRLDAYPIEAAYALGRLRATEAMRPLVDRLVFPPLDTVWDNLNNIAIAWALGNIGDKGAIEPLTRLLKSRSLAVLTVARWALWRIDNTSAPPNGVEEIAPSKNDGQWYEEFTICEESDNPAIKTLIPYIVTTCSFRPKISKGSGQ